MIKQMLSTIEAADILRVSDQTVTNWFHDGVFPNAIKLNPSKRNSPIRIPREDVDALRKAQRAPMAGQGKKLRA